MANPYFNAKLYLANNPDLVLAGFTVDNVEQHYLQYGANESVSVASRAPNTWFDAQFYLLSNPDLISAGLGLSDALAHFAQYGVTEGRVFSTNPALSPSNFNAAGYATANADVATALGITDLANITPVQAGQLMGHYLAYGAAEGRTGQGATFVVNPGNTIAVDSNTSVILGSTGDDTFMWNAAPGGFDGASLNGLTGTDTLKIANLAAPTNVTVAAVEKIVIDAVTAGGTLTVTGSGVESLTVTNANAFTYNGAKVDALTLKGVQAVTANFTSTTGTTDALAVTTGTSGAQILTTTGVEQFNIAVGEDNTGLTLNANSVQGSALSATLTGGKAAVANAFTLGSTGSGDLSTVTIDGSAALGNQTLSLDVGTSAIASLSVTITGGAGVDIIHANKGIDTLTGGAKNDTFNFSAGDAVVKLDSAGKISAVDKITDFTKNATDSALNDKVVAVDIVQIGAVDAAVGTVDGNGVLTFATGVTSGKTLTDIVKLLSSDATLATAGDSVIFSFGGSTYVYATDAVAANIEGDALIELAGVSASSIKLIVGGVEFA